MDRYKAHRYFNGGFLYFTPKNGRIFFRANFLSSPTGCSTANSRLHQVERERQRDLIRQLYHHFGQPLGSQKIFKNNVGLSFLLFMDFCLCRWEMGWWQFMDMGLRYSWIDRCIDSNYPFRTVFRERF